MLRLSRRRWVINGPVRPKSSFPFAPRKRTQVGHRLMSGLGQQDSAQQIERAPTPSAIRWAKTARRDRRSNKMRATSTSAFCRGWCRWWVQKGGRQRRADAGPGRGRSTFKRWKARALHPDVRNCAPPLFDVIPKKSNGDRNEARDRPDRFEHACSHSCGRWHRPCCC